MIIQGYILGWSYTEGMTSYLNANSIRIFDYPGFSQPFTEQVRHNVLLMKMVSKLNSSANSMLSARMTVSSRPSLIPEKQKG